MFHRSARRSALVLLALALAIAIVHGGCSSSDGAVAADAGDDTGIDDFEDKHGPAVAVDIEPANAVLEMTDLANPPKLKLTAKVTHKDGATRTGDASWILARLDIASIGAATGEVTATGAAFGKTDVAAIVSGLTAKTELTVRLKAAAHDPGISAADEGLLISATAADPDVNGVAYPYDLTVFPRGLLPPEIMWNGGSAGDSYVIHFVGPNYDLAVFTKADPPSRYTLSKKLWDALVVTAAGADVSVELHRLSGGIARLSSKNNWKIADANLRGSIYYWSIGDGQIFKIDVTSGQRAPVFDSGPNTALGSPSPLNLPDPVPTPPWETTNGGKRCVACHAVSKDGSTLSSVFSRSAPGSTGPVGYVNVSDQSIKSIGDYQLNGTFQTLSPDGKLSVINLGVRQLRLTDTQTGAVLPSTFDGMNELCDPMFSPDGSLFAVAAKCTAPGYTDPVEFATSDLVIYDFAQGTKAFTNPRTVLTSTGVGDAIAFPSFAPDSKWVFYQRGTFSRAKFGTNQHGEDDLFVARAEATATQIALDNANGKGVLPADSMHLNYAPTVNPIAEGGYIWVVFTSPRDYGNRMVSPRGTAPDDATYRNHKQLWVTAVDAAIGTVDPSHPAFWLSGQDPLSANMFGYWALAPCKPTGSANAAASCSAGFECCSGFCRDSGNGPVCVDQATGCHRVGEKCAIKADCCTSGPAVDCIGGVCQQTSIR